MAPYRTSRKMHQRFFPAPSWCGVLTALVGTLMDLRFCGDSVRCPEELGIGNVMPVSERRVHVLHGFLVSQGKFVAMIEVLMFCRSELLVEKFNVHRCYGRD